MDRLNVATICVRIDGPLLSTEAPCHTSLIALQIEAVKSLTVTIQKLDKTATMAEYVQYSAVLYNITVEYLFFISRRCDFHHTYISSSYLHRATVHIRVVIIEKGQDAATVPLLSPNEWITDGQTTRPTQTFSESHTFEVSHFTDISLKTEYFA